MSGGGEFAHWTRFQFCMEIVCIYSHKICSDMRSKITFHRFAVIWSDALTRSCPVRSQSVENLFFFLLLLLVGRAKHKFHRIGRLFHHYHVNKLPVDIFLCACSAFSMSNGFCSGENGRNFSQSQSGEEKNQKKYFLRNYLLFSTVNFTIILFTDRIVCVVVQASSAGVAPCCGEIIIFVFTSCWNSVLLTFSHAAYALRTSAIYFCFVHFVPSLSAEGVIKP